MKVSSEQQPSREAVLTVELDEKDVEPYLDRAYRQVVQRLSIPGFRKGKAPRRIVEQLYGRGYLMNEALDFMVQDVTTKAVEQEDLELGGIPSVSIEQFDPPSFKATVPLVPAIELGDYESVRVPRDEVKVDDEQVDTVLKQLREEMGVWEPVERASALEDLLNLTVAGWTEENGEQKEVLNSESTDYVPRTETQFPIPGFDDALVGLGEGETKEFSLDVPEDSENKEIAGKTVYFKVTVHSVKGRELPALDDEFAKGVGEGFESLEALQDRIRQNLRDQEERNVKSKHEQEVLDKVVEGAAMEVSPLIIDHEVEHVIEEREEKIKTGRMSFEEYQEFLASAGKSPEELKEDIKPQVELRLKRAHVLREIVERRGLETSDEELSDEIETMAEEAGEQAEEVRKLFAEDERRESIRRMLVNRKAVEHLTQIALGEAEKPAAPKRSRKKPQSAEGNAQAAQEEEGGT
ncbi:MAG: trigger factor [Dehalococcoidia bacterium]